MNDIIQLTKSQKIGDIPQNSFNHKIWQELKHHGKFMHFKKKKNLFIEGEEILFIFILVSGYIKLFNKTETLDIIEPSESMGAGLLSFNQLKNYYPISAQALTDIEVIAIEINKFDSLIENKVELTKYFFNQFKKRMLFMQNLRKIRAKSVKNRVAFFIQHKNHLLNKEFCTRKLIGELVSTTTESVIRTLSLLSKEQIISLESKQIKILNEHVIYKLADISE